MGTGHGSGFEKVGWAIGDRPIELFLSVLDAREDRCDCDELECAAHRKALIGAIGKHPAAAYIESGHTQTPAVMLFEGSKRGLAGCSSVGCDG